MITGKDIQEIQSALDAGIIFTFEFGDDTRILRKVGNAYTVYAPNSTLQSPMTVRQAMLALISWHSIIIKRQEKFAKRRYVEQAEQEEWIA